MKNRQIQKIRRERSRKLLELAEIRQQVFRVNTTQETHRKFPAHHDAISVSVPELARTSAPLGGGGQRSDLRLRLKFPVILIGYGDIALELLQQHDANGARGADDLR